MLSFEIDKLVNISKIGYSICDIGWELGPRENSDYELLILYHGKGEVCYKSHKYLLTPGDCVLIKPHEVHTLKSVIGQACRFYYAHFSPSTDVINITKEEMKCILISSLKQVKETTHFHYLPQTHFKRIFLADYLSLEDSADQIYTIFEKAIEQRNQFNILSNMSIDLNVCEILIILTLLNIKNLAIDFSLQSDGKINKLLSEAIHYIEKNYAKSITVEDISMHVGITPQYLNSLFNKEMGLTTIRYIIKYRILAAKDLIRNTNLSIKEICYSVGFETPHYFSRIFKKLEGVTPIEFKSRLNSKSNE